jgi:hypothetical protein
MHLLVGVVMATRNGLHTLLSMLTWPPVRTSLTPDTGAFCRQHAQQRQLGNAIQGPHHRPDGYEYIRHRQIKHQTCKSTPRRLHLFGTCLC